MRQAAVSLAAVGLLVTGALVLTAGPAEAQRKFLERVRRDYMLHPREIGKCDLCHKLGPKEDPTRENINDFGKAIQNHADFKPLAGKSDEYKFTKEELDLLQKIVVSLEGQDTDGDGATNKEELELSTFPGDAASKPDPKKLEDFRAKNKK
ncbi:MAG: hypothetical protein HS116_19470 [Planctomycetes bacterium]|nr:hypothetical protein [Planctomycetota bacterium]